MGDLWLPDDRWEAPRFFDPTLDPAGPVRVNPARGLPRLETLVYKGRNWVTNNNVLEYGGSASYIPGRGVVCPGGSGDYAGVYSQYPSGAEPISILVQYRPYEFDTGTNKNILSIGYGGTHDQIVFVSEDNGLSIAWYGARTIAMKNQLSAGQLVTAVLTVGATVASNRMFMLGAERSWSYEGGSSFTRTTSANRLIVMGAGPIAPSSFAGPMAVDVTLLAIFEGIIAPPMAAIMSARPYSLLFGPG